MQKMIKIFMDMFLFGVSFIASFLIRFEMMIPSPYWNRILRLLPILVVIRICVFLFFKIYHFDYNYFSVPNAISLFKAVFYSSMIFSVVCLSSPNYFGCPRSVLIIDGLLLFVIVCFTRCLLRLIKRETLMKLKNGRHILIVGAGDAGESVLREIRCYNRYHYRPIGLIDDNPRKYGKIIQGIRVLGNTKSIPEIVSRYNVEELIIAIPSASHEQLSEILDICNGLRINMLRVPSLCEINEKKSLINQLKETKPENVLFRKQVEWDCKSLAKGILEKRILVTGAGGSIGKELCRQIAKYKPNDLILFDNCEYNIFCISKELKEKYPYLNFRPIIADITDYGLTHKILKTYKPDIIFHAAAYKHVSLVEINPEIAIKNNIIGTKNIAQAAMTEHVSKLVFISSDKAVNPNSIMGATKRICEEYIKRVSMENGNKFFGVRFGNVLGSSGSVLEIFKDQIAKGGPVTVTDINAYRYFMTIPEAAHLVLETLLLAKGGEIFVLDMGKAVRIYDFAKELIIKSGYRPGIDIEIIFTGLKKGEKLVEQLREDSEKLNPTQNKKILKVKSNNGSAEDLVQLDNDINELMNYANDMNRKALMQKIKQMVPTYKSPVLDIPRDFSELDSININ